MNLYREPSKLHIPTVGGVNQPNINHRRLDLAYSSDTVPFTIALDVRDGSDNQNVSHVFLDSVNVGTFTISIGSAGTVTPTKTFDFGGETRQSTIVSLGSVISASTVSITIATKSDATIPVKIYRAMGLDLLLNFPPYRVFRDVDFTQQNNHLEYESLYGSVSAERNYRLQPRGGTFLAKRRTEVERDALSSIMQLNPEFVFEYNNDEAPAEIYRAVWDGGINATYSTTRTGDGFDLGFSVRER